VILIFPVYPIEGQLMAVDHEKGIIHQRVEIRDLGQIGDQIIALGKLPPSFRLVGKSSCGLKDVDSLDLIADSQKGSFPVRAVTRSWIRGRPAIKGDSWFVLRRGAPSVRMVPERLRPTGDGDFPPDCQRLPM
jgi:hypothetical protein